MSIIDTVADNFENNLLETIEDIDMLPTSLRELRRVSAWIVGETLLKAIWDTVKDYNPKTVEANINSNFDNMLARRDITLKDQTLLCSQSHNDYMRDLDARHGTSEQYDVTYGFEIHPRDIWLFVPTRIVRTKTWGYHVN